jgi:predicted transcriptional regulator
MEKTIKEQTVILFLRIPISWNEKIEKIVDLEMRTKSSVVKQAIKEFLQRRKQIR